MHKHAIYIDGTPLDWLEGISLAPERSGHALRLHASIFLLQCRLILQYSEWVYHTIILWFLK